MKKFISIAMALSVICAASACAADKKTAETTLPEVTSENISDAPVAGGWESKELNEAADMDADIREVFTKAAEAAEKKLVPIALLGTQVVAGTNYAFLCTEDGKAKIAVIYEDLEKKAEITSIKDFDFVNYTSKDTAAPEGELAGGWTVGDAVKEQPLSEEDEAVFEKALNRYTGMGYAPLAMLGTQVVAGTNYAVLCKGAPVVPDAAENIYVVTIYDGVDGKTEISGVACVDLADFNG